MSRGVDIAVTLGLLLALLYAVYVVAPRWDPSWAAAWLVDRFGRASRWIVHGVGVAAILVVSVLIGALGDRLLLLVKGG
jgi:MFS family permease